MVEYIKLSLFFVAGIYSYKSVGPSFVIFFIISLFMVLTIKAFFKHKFDAKILICAIFFSVGVLLCSYSVSTNNHDLSDYEGRYVTLTGRISRLPDVSGENIRYVVDVKNLTHDGEDKQIDGRIVLSSKSDFEYGDTVTFSGFLEDLPDKMNENGFDYSMYYKSRGVFFKMYSEEMAPSSYNIKDYSPLAISLSVKNFMSNVIDDNYSGDYNALLKAILIGNKKEFSEDFDKILTRTGMKRFFYPAFLHVAIFMGAITFLLSFISRKKRDIMIILLLIIYALLNYDNAVFIKLSLLIAVTTYLKIRNGYLHYPDALGITGIIIGVTNPLIFFDVGFMMSITASMLMYYFYEFIYKFTKFARFKYIRHLLTLNFICTVGLLPVSAYFLGYISPYNIIFSFIAIPAVAGIVMASPLLILMLSVFHYAPVIRQFVSCMLFILKNMAVIADKLNMVNIIVPRPGMVFIVAYILFIVAVANYIRKNLLYAKVSAFVGAALTVSVVVCQIMRMGSIEMTFVNVGQGDGTIISSPYQFNILIDGGGGTTYSEYNPGEKIYLEYLETEGITKIDSAFVSHYHQDHVQGIIAAVENLNVRNLFMPDCMEDNEWRQALETAAVENNTKIHYISKETILKYNNEMRIHIIPPAYKTGISDDENDTSIVYYLEYKDISAVFTGDMSKFAENNLIESGKVKEADILKVAHHGSKNSTGEEWISAISPKYAVISVGEDNSYGLPDDEVVERLEYADIDIYRTDFDGDIRFTINSDGSMEIETFDRR